MINANELRIGNKILNVDGDIVTVNELRDEFYIADFGGQFYSTAKGIELTPEILEKCGFVKEEKDTRRIDIPSAKYQVYGNGHFTFNSIHGWWFNGKQLDVQPQYLHQLQNLYFALTGTELKVKL